MTLSGKRFGLTVGIVALGAVAAHAQVALLAGQGTSGAPFTTSTAIPSNYLQVDSLTANFTGVDPVNGNTVYTGHLLSTVYRNQTDNTLLFAYKVFNDASSTDPVEKIAIGGYKQYSTAVAQQQNSATDVYASNAARDTDGSPISFGFVRPTAGLGVVDHGLNSTSLWVKTSAVSYTVQAAGVLNTVGTQTTALAPVPEPVSLLVIATGVAGLVARRRKRA